MKENLIYQPLELPVSHRNIFYQYSFSFIVGVTMGMTILYAFIRPFEPVLLFFIIPMPVIVAVGAFVAYDLYRAVTHRQGNIGSAGHIGGAIAGTLYYFLKIRGRL
jgi:membrane associated rhomboid family serine protease